MRAFGPLLARLLPRNESSSTLRYGDSFCVILFAVTHRVARGHAVQVYAVFVAEVFAVMVRHEIVKTQVLIHTILESVTESITLVGLVFRRQLEFGQGRLQLFVCVSPHILFCQIQFVEVLFGENKSEVFHAVTVCSNQLLF